jgi:hypothetical protein
VAKRNDYAGRCSVCDEPVEANEGTMVYDPDSPYAGRRGYLILCVEHSPDGSFEPPAPPEASRLPSIHRDEEKYER